MASVLIHRLSVRIPLCLVFVIFLGSVPAPSQSVTPILEGELFCVSSTFSLTVLEVKGDSSKMFPVSTVMSPLRPPRVDLYPSYNSLLIEEDGDRRTLFIPDSNMLRIIELNSQTEDTVRLPSCDPLLLRRFEAVLNEIWVLCNPDGVSLSVLLYRLVGDGEGGWTAETPVTIVSGNGSLLKDVGFVFRRNEEVYVVVATPTQVVWFIPRKNMRDMQSISRCGRVQQIAEFSNDSLLFECGQANDPSKAVHTTLLYNLSTAVANRTVLSQGRMGGKIIFSKDKRVVGKVSSDRIAVELLMDGVPKQMVPLISVGTNDIHDAFIETTNGEYTLVYARSGGGVYFYNITAALDGNDVAPQKITEEEKTCETNCVSLLPIGSGFFAVGLSEPEGVGWYSLSPPKRIGFASGAPSARLAFFLTGNDPSVVIDDRMVPSVGDQEGLSGGQLGGIVAGVITPLFIITVAVVTVMLMRDRRRR